MDALIVGGGLLAGIGVLVAVLGLRPAAPTEADLVAERLGAYQDAVRGAAPPINLSEEELGLRFDQRVIWPTLRRMGAALARRTPEASRVELQRTLNLAGRPLGLSASEFLAVRYMVIAVLAVAVGVLGLAIGGVVFALFGTVFGALVGFVVPRFLVSARVSRARREIQLTLPDAMDLMSVCVEAGLTFEGAMGKVAERYDNTLGAEYGQVLREIRLGRPRREAMADLGDRCGVAELQSFAQAVIQSDTLGTGISRILRIQSDELRRRRRQRAQEQGAKAGLKILFPMVMFIFPSLWIVLLGPAGLLLLQEFGGR